MWRKFRFTRAVVSGDVQRRFRRYCMYAFGLPLLLTMLLAALEFSPIEDHTLLPRMRKRECFLSGKGKLIYLYLPITLVCISNIVLFVLTTIFIIKTKNKTKRHLKSEDSKNSKARDKQRLLTYVKLFIVMGVTWILEVVSYVLPEAGILWKISDAFNALSGLFVFIIVVCNKEKISSLQKRFKEIFNIQKDTISVTMNMDLSQSVLKNYQNAEEKRKTGKNTNQGLKTSETKQNSNVNQISETGSLLSQMNKTNERLNEHKLDISEGQRTKEDAMSNEKKECETFGNTDSAIIYHKKDDSQNERLINEYGSSIKEDDTRFVEQIPSSDKTYNNDQENGCHISEKNSGMNERLNEHKSDFSEGQRTKEDAMSNEKKECETFGNTDSPIIYHKKDDSQNERLTNEYESSIKEDDTRFVEQIPSSDKTYNNYQENGCHISEENRGMNESCKNEKYSKPEENSNTINTPKINEEDVSQENESSSTLDGDNKYDNEVKTDDNE
ncbi:Probable G-protein coupled receptor Mth-like 1 [Eumeta japonica]|uniref:Probable G-protein coupled receptor Mth-like 1 n=1 Tax=Eumeta variegata TaxID=151549 RepID=A0A4C1WRE5_EUMVA|nr:Probable G-protein coupled receptor Mth-like 1 [Eumeta japonica]